MSVVICGVCPHPPIVVPEVGGGQAARVAATQQALLELGRRVKQSGADTIVFISPHAPLFQDTIGINRSTVLRGDLAGFRAPGVRFELPNDLELAEAIKSQAAGLDLPVTDYTEEMAGRYRFSLLLDHGVTVPLYFMRKAGVSLPLVCASMALLPPAKLYRFGLAVSRAALELGRRVALLASGDLSHCLEYGAPGGYHPRGEEFDREVVRLLAGADFPGLLKMDETMVREAGECGYRPIIMMLGALDGYEVEAEVLSYEGPFGVGYLAASLLPVVKNAKLSLEAGVRLGDGEEAGPGSSEESYLVKVARQSLESFVTGSSRPDLTGIPEEFNRPAGTFVSIKKNGHLRGCIGTINPANSSIVEEVADNAISAGVRDPRFPPVGRDELSELEYSVDVLMPPETVRDISDLDHKKYGVIVRAGRRSGLLLPNLEGIGSVDEQVAIARQKAGIGPEEPVQLERFEVIRHK